MKKSEIYVNQYGELIYPEKDALYGMNVIKERVVIGFNSNGGFQFSR